MILDIIYTILTFMFCVYSNHILFNVGMKGGLIVHFPLILKIVLWLKYLSSKVLFVLIVYLIWS